MRIAVDAMGGDYAPTEQVRGAIEAAKLDGTEIILVGVEERLKEELSGYDIEGLPITIVNASEVIGMDEHPAFAIRKKRNSSIALSMDLVKSGEADGVVALGNTGATVAAAIMKLGRIPGIERPAIACPMPNKEGFSLLLDAGANADCKPLHLLHFAIMGSIYMEKIQRIKAPSVGLLNIGEEPGKGSELYINAHKLLRESDINFIGNIEGRDIMAGKVDILLCDGFVGNVILKFAEGVGATIFDILKMEVEKSPLAKAGGALLKPSFKTLKKRMDPAEYGGVSLLGVDGVCVIGHGNSKAKAVYNAIRAACQGVEGNVVNAIKNYITHLGDGMGDE